MADETKAMSEDASKDSKADKRAAKEAKKEETFLYLRLNVKREGYFNGEITLGESNFTFKEAESSYVSKVEANKLYLNQINAGTVEEIKIKIEPMKEESFSVGMLNMVSKIIMNGELVKTIYWDLSRSYTETISPDLLPMPNKSGAYQIEILTNGKYNPKEMGISEDNRDLAIRLSYMGAVKQ